MGNAAEVIEIETPEEVQENLDLVGDEVTAVEPEPIINPELDDIVEEATTTKADAAKSDHEPEGSKATSEVVFDHKAAMGMAAKGVQQLVAVVSEKSGVEVGLGSEAQMVLAVLLAPAVMKHGESIKRYLSSDNIDLNSNVPEYMAGAAIVGLSGYMIFSVKSAKKAELADGDKS